MIPSLRVLPFVSCKNTVFTHHPPSLGNKASSSHAAWGITMKLARRTFMQFAGAAGVAPALPRIAMAQAFPSRPITMIVPFPAGGPADAPGRVMAERGREVRSERTAGVFVTVEPGARRFARPRPKPRSRRGAGPSPSRSRCWRVSSAAPRSVFRRGRS